MAHLCFTQVIENLLCVRGAGLGIVRVECIYVIPLLRLLMRSEGAGREVGERCSATKDSTKLKIWTILCGTAK